MRKLFWVLAVFAAGLVALLWIVGRDEPAPGPVETAPAAPVPPAPPSRGEPAEPPDAALLARARELLGADAREESCGPYALHTDVTAPDLLAACGRLAARLDDLYEERYGVRPLGAPAEAIVLFAEIGSYRELSPEVGVPLGYAGYTLATRGLAVFYAGDPPYRTFLPTLTHELTHLVSRRALGVNLPPWLSEGLSDGIGDTATAAGFGPVEGIAGSEAQARRLREAYASDRAGSLRRLVALQRSEFDRGTVSFDYEQSALFVRFLLSEPDLAPAFRAFLRDLSRGEIHPPERLASVLGVEWMELERRFEAWVREVG